MPAPVKIAVESDCNRPLTYYRVSSQCKAMLGETWRTCSSLFVTCCYSSPLLVLCKICPCIYSTGPQALLNVGFYSSSQMVITYSIYELVVQVINIGHINCKVLHFILSSDPQIPAWTIASHFSVYPDYAAPLNQNSYISLAYHSIWLCILYSAYILRFLWVLHLYEESRRFYGILHKF